MSHAKYMKKGLNNVKKVDAKQGERQKWRKEQKPFWRLWIPLEKKRREMGTEVKQTKYIYEQVNKQLNKINVNKLYSTLIISNSQWRRQRFLSGRAKATSHWQEQSLVECVCGGGGERGEYQECNFASNFRLLPYLTTLVHHIRLFRFQPPENENSEVNVSAMY